MPLARKSAQFDNDEARMTNDKLMLNLKFFDIRHSDFGIKKVPPPTPDGREGRLFPPEQSSKIWELLPELKGCRNKNFYKLCSASYEPLVSQVRMSTFRVTRFPLGA
jgi:hypothetical protein